MIRARSFVADLLLSCVLIGLSPAASSEEDIPVAVREAMSRGDHVAIAKYYEDASSKRHEVVAKHYENTAREIHDKILEQKQLLERYQDKSYFYGRDSLDLQARAEALIRKYESAAKANMQEAAVHRQLASKLKENSNSASAPVKSSEFISIR
jgi:predicted S18 family serine protease